MVTFINNKPLFSAKRQNTNQWQKIEFKIDSKFDGNSNRFNLITWRGSCECGWDIVYNINWSGRRAPINFEGGKTRRTCLAVKNGKSLLSLHFEKILYFALSWNAFFRYHAPMSTFWSRYLSHLENKLTLYSVGGCISWILIK